MCVSYRNKSQASGYDPLFCYKGKPWRLFKETLSSGLIVQLTWVSSEHTYVICNNVVGPKSLKNTVPTTAKGEGTGSRPTVRHKSRLHQNCLGLVETQLQGSSAEAADAMGAEWKLESLCDCLVQTQPTCTSSKELTWVQPDRTGEAERQPWANARSSIHISSLSAVS